MAVKKPVLATCYGGSYEAVVDGETGYLIRPYETAEFAKKLVQLLLDDSLRHRMGEAGYDRVRTQFTIEQQVTGMLMVYQQAIAQVKA